MKNWFVFLVLSNDICVISLFFKDIEFEIKSKTSLERTNKVEFAILPLLGLFW